MIKLLFLLFCIGCSQGLRAAPEREAALSKYIDNFVNMARIELTSPDFNIGNLEYKFENMGDKDNIAGTCLMNPSYPVIRINSYYWNDFSEAEKQELMFHELGHCLLFRGHREDKFTDNTPKSIMYPVMMREFILNKRYDYYIHELFNETYTETFKKVEYVDYIN